MRDKKSYGKGRRAELTIICKTLCRAARRDARQVFRFLTPTTGNSTDPKLKIMKKSRFFHRIGLILRFKTNLSRTTGSGAGGRRVESTIICKTL
jgi:hypothetical protein